MVLNNLFLCKLKCCESCSCTDSSTALWYHSLCKNMLMSLCYYNPDCVSNQLLHHSWKTPSTLLLSLVPSPYLHVRETVWCTKFKYLALFPKMRNVQSNYRMITSSHRNEIATYRVRESIIPCACVDLSGHQNGNPITRSIILIGLTSCVM